MTRPTLELHQEALRRGAYLRVVNWHSTPVGQAAALERELAAYARVFAPVDLDDLDRFVATGRWHRDRPGLLPVFYEGYRNALSAAEVCERVGLVGWFFVVTGFVRTPPAEQEAFARSHRIVLSEEDLAADRIALSPDEVRDLARRGHVVAAHTASHEGLESALSDADLEREVVEPRRWLEDVTGREVASFAWLHGSAYGRSPRHDAAVRAAGYRYQVSNTMVQRLPRT